jgi:energy-coupling factor transporter ATP-binding protein EcfA2
MLRVVRPQCLDRRRRHHPRRRLIATGEMCGLIGRNGAGKTTLMRALMGAMPASGMAEPSTESISCPAGAWPGRPRHRLHAGGPPPGPDFTVEDNIRLPSLDYGQVTRRRERLAWIFHHAGSGARSRPARARIVRRPAEDGGAGARAHGGPAHAAARRAVRRPGAGTGAAARRSLGQPQGDRSRCCSRNRTRSTSPTCSRASIRIERGAVEG